MIENVKIKNKLFSLLGVRIEDGRVITEISKYYK